jgi:deoxyribodipyrimidine photo-lyase
MKKAITIFWFRRDLRIDDNTGLYFSLKDSNNVIPLFIFDTLILHKLEEKEDSRISFIYFQIKTLKEYFEKKGSSLIVKIGKPIEVFNELNDTYQIKSIYANEDYEPYARDRDTEIHTFLKSHNIAFHLFKDQVILAKDDVLKKDGKPYTVFTPYMKMWKSHFYSQQIPGYDITGFDHNFFMTKHFRLPGIEETGFTKSDKDFPSSELNIEKIRNYDKTRDYPALNGTSRLGIHLRFGTISIRKLVQVAQENNETFLNELIWREFYMMILWYFPRVVETSFRQEYDAIPWRNNEEEFKAWCDGRTGYPIVDAGMTQLNETGYMHNRLRMITASFLAKHILVDWRWGEAYFASKLLDYELSSNNGGWQWAAGTGCDAAPYFRIFNPDLQTKKFDPELKYIQTWLPEFREDSYADRIVEHSFARQRALDVYKKTLNKFKS